MLRIKRGKINVMNICKKKTEYAQRGKIDYLCIKKIQSAEFATRAAF